MSQPLALTRHGDWSFRLASGSAVDLAAWLFEHHGYSRRSVKNSLLECERCERGPAHNRAIVIAFHSGAVLVQGSAQPRQTAADLLASLVIDTPPGAEQLRLFGGTVEETPDGGLWVAFGGAE
jgi:hypothetical protein